MKVKTENLIIVVISLVALLTYSFPFSSYIRTAVICGGAFYSILLNLKKPQMKRSIYIYCYSLFCLWGGLSYFWAATTQGVDEQFTNMLNAIMVNLAIMMHIVSKREKLEDIYKWFAPIMLIYLIQSILVGSFNLDQRFSPSGATNQFGISAANIYFLALYGIKFRKSNKNILYLIVAISVLLSILSGSRKALVSLVLFTCMVFLFSEYSNNVLKNLGKIALVICVAVVVVYAFIKIQVLYDAVGRRLETLIAYFGGETSEDLSALQRDYMKADAIELFLMHPIKGVGLNNFKYIARYGTYAHSNYYEMLANLGIVGTALYYLPIIITTIMAFFQWKRKIPNSAIQFSILLCFIVMEFSNISYIYRNIQIFVGLAAGLTFAAEMQYCSNRFKTGIGLALEYKRS